MNVRKNPCSIVVPNRPNRGSASSPWRPRKTEDSPAPSVRVDWYALGVLLLMLASLAASVESLRSASAAAAFDDAPLTPPRQARMEPLTASRRGI